MRLMKSGRKVSKAGGMVSGSYIIDDASHGGHRQD